MNKPKIYVSCKTIGDAVDRLKERFNVTYRDNPHPAAISEIQSVVRDVDALICVLDDKIDSEFLSSCSKLKVVANVAVGYDNIDVDEATRRGILVLNTPGVLTNATADLAFALLLAASRRIAESDRLVRSGKWSGWSADFMLGRELSNKTLGIVGMGRIGEAVARRAAAFGMSIVYTRRGDEEKDSRLKDVYGAIRVSLGELLSRSDFISIHCPLSEATRHLIGKSEFARMKPECILINTSRGAVLDQAALIDALKTGRIAGAGLDVYEGEPGVPQELCKMDNVVLCPHIGSATIETRAAMSDLAVDGVLSAFAGVLPRNAVNDEIWAKSVLSGAQVTERGKV